MTDVSKIIPHRKQEIAPGNIFIVSTQDETLSPKDVFGTFSAPQLRELFRAAANPADAAEPAAPLILINWGDYPNSKQDNLHMHVLTADPAPEFSHIKDKKTYVPRPNQNITASVASQVTDTGMKILDLSGHQDIAEANAHQVIANRKYRSFNDFSMTAPDDEISAFAQTLNEIITRESEGGRIVIDERFNNTGFFTVHFVGGEYLGQEGNDRARWFEPPTLAP